MLLRTDLPGKPVQITSKPAQIILVDIVSHGFYAKQLGDTDQQQHMPKIHWAKKEPPTFAEGSTNN
jgi:hypothetical protein